MAKAESISEARKIVNMFTGYEIGDTVRFHLSRSEAVIAARLFCMDMDKWPDGLKRFYLHEATLSNGKLMPLSLDQSCSVIAEFIVFTREPKLKIGE